MKKPRFRLRNLLTLTFASALGAGVMSLATLFLAWHAHNDTLRSEATKTLWEKQQSVYADLLDVSAQAAAAPLAADDYRKLHDRFYRVSGPLEVYRTREMGDCVTTLRDLLSACAYPEQTHRETCDASRFHGLHQRLSYDARQSLIRTWDQHPRDFIDDRFATELCRVK